METVHGGRECLGQDLESGVRGGTTGGHHRGGPRELQECGVSATAQSDFVLRFVVQGWRLVEHNHVVWLRWKP